MIRKSINGQAFASGTRIARVSALVLVIAATMNWRNQCTGFTLNLVLADPMDAALVAFLLAPARS